MSRYPLAACDRLATEAESARSQPLHVRRADWSTGKCGVVLPVLAGGSDGSIKHGRLHARGGFTPLAAEDAPDTVVYASIVEGRFPGSPHLRRELCQC
jgi:hypothetical protein